MVFQMATILLFTFYFAADAPRIERALLSRMPPDRQRVTGWVWDTAIEQTGGYFYSRMILVVINGGLAALGALLVALFGFGFIGAPELAMSGVGFCLGGVFPIMIGFAGIALPRSAGTAVGLAEHRPRAHAVNRSHLR